MQNVTAVFTDYTDSTRHGDVIVVVSFPQSESLELEPLPKWMSSKREKWKEKGEEEREKESDGVRQKCISI